jgi:preprotein translocase subunit YajC
VISVPLLIFAAPGGSAGGRGLGIFLFQMVAFILIIYFILIRPKVQQEKKHRERLAQLRSGDEVITVGGIVGKVVHMKDDRLTLKTGDVRVEVQRDRIAEVVPTKEAGS